MRIIEPLDDPGEGCDPGPPAELRLLPRNRMARHPTQRIELSQLPRRVADCPVAVIRAVRRWNSTSSASEPSAHCVQARSGSTH